jgi:hypothetical protein
MDQHGPAPLNTSELLRQSWRLFRSHLQIFVPLMGFPIGALILGGAIMYLLLPDSPSRPLREVMTSATTFDLLVVVFLFLAAIAVLYRVLGATTWAAAEFHKGGNPGVWEAFRHVAGKQARLLWLLFVIGLFSRGPLFFIPLLAGFAVAPALPVAALENLGVIKAIQRGDALSKGHQRRIALLYILSIVPVVAGVPALIILIIFLQDSIGNVWFLRPVFPLGFWIILLIPQFYMVALTLNYFDMRVRKGEWPAAVGKDPSVPTFLRQV